jgi:hypothetical protein
MATPPDFTSGAILTAAQMNGIGMWKVRPTSVSGTGATINSTGSVIVASGANAVNIEGCFTSDFSSYEVVISNMRVSTDSNVNWRFRSASGLVNTSSYYVGGSDGTAYGAAVTQVLTNLIAAPAATGGAKLTIINPQLAEESGFYCLGTDFRAAGNSGKMISGFENSNTSMTGITVYANNGAATITAATIAIYGYR